MKLRKIKKITIGDTVFDIIWDKNIGGGSFEFVNKELTIGTKYGKLVTFTTIIHELKEIIQTEQYVRHNRIDVDSEFIFVYNHAQHTDLCCRLSGLLSQFII